MLFLVLGGLVCTAAFIGAFFTAGATLPIVLIVGSATGVLGGATAGGTYFVNKYLKSGIVDSINKKLDEDKKITEELQKKIKEIEKEKSPILTDAWNGLKTAGAAGAGIKGAVAGGMQLADAGLLEGAESLFQAFNNVGKVMHGVGLAVSIIFIIPDIITIVKTSVKVHKGEEVGVVQKVRMIADELEKEINEIANHF